LISTTGNLIGNAARNREAKRRKIKGKYTSRMWERRLIYERGGKNCVIG